MMADAKNRARSRACLPRLGLGCLFRQHHDEPIQPRHLLPRDHQEYRPEAGGNRSAKAVPDLPATAVATDGNLSIDEENTRLEAMKICRNCLPSPTDDGAREARRHEPSISRREIATIPAAGARN